MNFIQILKLMVIGLVAAQTGKADREITRDFVLGDYVFLPQCIGFTVGHSTECTWMCEYCVEQLGTTDYHFTDGVCKYDESGSCLGSPEGNHQYTCCAN